MPSYRLYVLGNPLHEGDSLPLRLLPRLRKRFPLLSFIEWDPTEEFPEEETLHLIDTIANTPRVVVWTDVNSIKSSPTYSVHDFDLGMTLKLLKKMGRIHGVKIFGVPPQGDEDSLFEELCTVIANSLLKNASRN